MPDSYVQVRFEDNPKHYTYRDPSGFLGLGDEIEVEPGVSVTVTSLVPDWTGLFKEITAKPTKKGAP